MKKRFSDRFLPLIAVETRAKENAGCTPSSAGQLELGRLLSTELKTLGLDAVEQDKHGYVTGILPSNIDRKIPRFALIAHIDTAPDLSGRNEHPGIIEYTGGDIRLQNGALISRENFPFLGNLEGHTLVTTDGTTLLGADNKAGIAILLETIARIQEEKICHGDIAIVFTPDEEIGHGAGLLDLDKLGASFGYTFDGGGLGEFNIETFNAAAAVLTITGKIVHPGSAKNIMVNAVNLAGEFLALLPAAERPETTEGREGFYYVNHLQADTEKSVIRLIVRDHDKERFGQRKRFLESAVAFLCSKHGDRFSLEIFDQYYNLKEKLDEMPVITELALKAMHDCGIEPVILPVRGGTDGARLSWRGLPCPNFFTGGYNFHSKSEILSVDEALRAVEVACALTKNIAAHDWSKFDDQMK